MRILKEYPNKFFIYIKSKLHRFIFLTSIISLLFVFLNLINLNEILGLSQIFCLESLFQVAVIFGMIFVVLFLPTYPIFFIIYKSKAYTFLEKLSLTIITNLTFYILVGYIGYVINIPLTGLFFFITLVIFFFIIISYVIYQEFTNERYIFFRAFKSSDKNKAGINSFSLIDVLKQKFSLNGILLIIFILLVCILNLLRFVYFFGTDPWLHITIIKKISVINYLPYTEYYGTLGFHIFGAVIHFFSGIDVILVPRYFIFYTFFVSALVCYNLFLRIFKNQNLALFGVFILSFSSLNFSYEMLQFWPTSIAVILSLYIFFLLYVRLQNFIQIDRPTKQEIKKDLYFNYVLITLIFIASLLTHALITAVLLITYIFIYLIYFVKDYKRGSDFLLLIILMGIFLIFYTFTLISKHFQLLLGSNFSIPWYIFVGAGIGGGLFIWRFQNSILYTTGRYTATIKGEQYSYYKTIEDKYIIPIAFGSVVFFTLFFLVGTILWFDIDVSNVFVGFEILILAAFGIWGFVLYQKKPRGKPLFIWGVGFAFIIAVVALYDIVFGSNSKFWSRLIYLSAPIIVMGFISYLYKLIKLGSFDKLWPRLFILFIVGFSVSVTFYSESVISVEFNLKERETTTIMWFSNHTSEKKVIIAEFGYDYVFMYYDFPYDDKDESLRSQDLHFFIKYTDNLFNPDNHFYENGTNVLQELKEMYGTDVYIMLDDFYFLNLGWDVYGQLTEDQMEEYYNMEYLDRIYNSKSESGEESPLYWVI